MLTRRLRTGVTVDTSITRPYTNAYGASESDRLIRLRLTGGDDAPRRARTALRSLLDGHVAPTPAWDAELVVSELVTNSVRHANVRGHEAVTLET